MTNKEIVESIKGYINRRDKEIEEKKSQLNLQKQVAEEKQKEGYSIIRELLDMEIMQANLKGLMYEENYFDMIKKLIKD